MEDTKAHGIQREELSTRQLLNIIENLKDDSNYPEAVLNALSNIVVTVHASYNNPDSYLQDTFNDIIQVLQARPVAYQDMEISKSALAKKPLLMQLLILMQDIVVKQQYIRSNKQIIWLAIALHTSILLIHIKVKSHTHNVLMQFKLAEFSESPSRTWIWKSLPDISELSMDVNGILSILLTILEQQETPLNRLDNSDAIGVIKSKDLRPEFQAKLSQIKKISLAYQNAHFLKASSTKSKNKKPPKKTKIKSINLATANPVYEPINNDPQPYYWDTTSDDIEKYIPKIDTRFFAAETEHHDGLTTSFEETIDHYDRPYVSYNELPDPLFRHSAPLQNIDLTLQQNYMSQRDLELSSNTRILSLVDYQSLFIALSHDATAATGGDNKRLARILLLSILTGLPIKSLNIPGYIGHPSIFSIGKNRAYIKHHLGITKRSDKFDSNIYENELDEVKIPVPLWLIKGIISTDLPTIEELNTYLSKLRRTLQLPYLSLNRIEIALHVILARNTPGCHSHIADIICRTPAPHAPALYYSSHSSEELIAHYKNALGQLNTNNSFNLSYITTWHKYTVGSVFAFKPQYVRNFITELKAWVKDSPNTDTHFNRTSILVWFVFCLLTGVRPNNGIGKMSDIDLETGWLLIYDKPSKNVQNHRLVPLCSTLIRYLTDYKSYLIDYQLRHPLNHEVSNCIDDINLGEDVALLRLLSDNASKLEVIKRGDAYQMTDQIIDANPYWTRHFVRTQLEKCGVNLALINTIIGHEKSRQEVLGQLSSSSKSKIKSVSSVFEHLANLLELDSPNKKTLHYYGETNHA